MFHCWLKRLRCTLLHERSELHNRLIDVVTRFPIHTVQDPVFKKHFIKIKDLYDAHQVEISVS